MRLAYAVALALVSAAATAQGPASQPGSHNPAAVTGGTYKADPNHTMVIWTLNHMGFSPLSGMFGQVTGTLTLDPKHPNAAKVDVTIPISKVVTTSGLTQHLLREGQNGGKPDFFGPNPGDAHFVSTSVAAHGDSATINGDLTLNGVTKPVTLNATFYGAGKMPAQMGGAENVGFHATGTIRRSEFGIGNFVPMVGDEVKLDIAAAFTKAG